MFNRKNLLVLTFLLAFQALTADELTFSQLTTPQKQAIKALPQ